MKTEKELWEVISHEVDASYGISQYVERMKFVLIMRQWL